MLIECKDLIKIYPSPFEGLSFPALRGLELSVRKGSLVSIIGPSGSGKTTLLRLISSFEVPSSGEVWYDGQLINQFSNEELLKYRENVGIMHQSPRENLFWGLNVLDNVLFPIRFSGKFLTNQHSKALELIERVGLSGKERRKPAQLSGGEQQRAAIAVALANEPQLLLADEPTGELDSYTTALIIDYIKDINSSLGVTMIVATHDKRFSQMTNLTYKILDGRLSTGYFKTQDTIQVQQDEVAIIDSHQSLRLPSSVFEQFKNLSKVKVVVKDGKIELIPYNSDK